MKKNNLLKRFPKQRKELSSEYMEIYQKEYLYNRGNDGIINSIKTSLENWMHKQCATIEAQKILEVGAGTLNHIDHENNYGRYDIVEPNSFLYSESKSLEKVNKIFKNINDIDKELYDKIVSIAVFEHIENLPIEIARLALRLKKDGILQVAIPSEGGFLWGLSWRISTALSFYFRHKLSYSKLMRYEHINNMDEIIGLLKLFFRDVSIKGFPFSNKHLSFYTYIEVKEPKVENCRAILKND